MQTFAKCLQNANVLQTFATLLPYGRIPYVRVCKTAFVDIFAVPVHPWIRVFFLPNAINFIAFIV